MIAVTAGMAMADYGDPVFGNPIYATQAGASWFYVTDQTVNIWGDDGNGNPVAVDTQHNVNTTVIQGADQNWGGTGNIMPVLINYDNFLGAPDYAAAGFGGAASGTWIDFSRDLMSGGTGDGAVFNEDRTRVTLYVTDGGAYDDDGIVNLQVSDPPAWVHRSLVAAGVDASSILSLVMRGKDKAGNLLRIRLQLRSLLLLAAAVLAMDGLQERAMPAKRQKQIQTGPHVNTRMVERRWLIVFKGSDNGPACRQNAIE